MRSAIYSGLVIHNRVLPKIHKFAYKMQMFCIAYDEIDNLGKSFKMISVDNFNILSFKRQNYLSKLDIQCKLMEHGFEYTADNIFILTHLSYLGFCYNPVSFYYCYNKQGTKVEFILAEINNTPWGERFVYCFECDKNKPTSKFILPKQFHISPFMPMDVEYQWYFYNSQKKIIIVLRSFRNNNMMFNATLQLRKSVITNLSICKYIFANFLITHMILVRIYWQALKLWLKKIPFYSHPRGLNE